jgi:hypothetical protein
MRVELRDSKTLVIIPECIAEQEMLLRFEGQAALIEQPQPLQQNIKPLIVKAENETPKGANS